MCCHRTPHFALAYHFYSRAFAQHIKKWRTPLIALYVLGVWVAIHRLLLINRTTLSFLAAHSSFTSSAESVMGLFYLFAPLSCCIAIVRNYLIVKDPDEHRRARWIVFGSVAGILPYAIVRAIGLIVYTTG